MRVDSYSFGSMAVDGKTYEADLIVFPDRVRPNWWRLEGHSLVPEDLREVVDFQPELLIVGKGAQGCMDVPAATVKALEEKHIQVISANTDKACQLFNKELQKGKKVVAAFHLTC